MRFATTAAILSLAAGIHAGVVPQEEITLEARQGSYGTFDTFTDIYCSRGGKGTTVGPGKTSGLLDRNIQSVKAYLPTCQLLVWNTQGGYPALEVSHGNNGCHRIPGTALSWRAVCHT